LVSAAWFVPAILAALKEYAQAPPSARVLVWQGGEGIDRPAGSVASGGFDSPGAIRPPARGPTWMADPNRELPIIDRIRSDARMRAALQWPA